MRILYVIGELALGGAERHLALVLPRLRRCGIQPFVYALVDKGDLAAELEAGGVPVRTVIGASALQRLPRPVRRFVRLPLTLLALVLWIVRLRPAMIHMFLPEAYLIGSLAAFIGRVPCRIMSRRSRNHYQQRHPQLGRVECWLHRHTDLLLGNSSRVVADLLGEGAPAERVRLLYNGIDASGRPCSRDRKPSPSMVRKMLGLAQEALVITVVANLIPYKGHADLIAALGIIQRQLPRNWVMVSVGEDRGILPALRDMTAAAGIEDHVRWLGKRRDVEQILAASDLGVLCSHEEGFSNALLEGMAAGLPMVVTDVGGNAEAIVDGVCGLVVPPHDPVSLGKALLKLADNRELRIALGTSARERVVDFFDVEVCVGNYAMLYQALRVQSPLPTVCPPASLAGEFRIVA
ncbi:MAG: glycosyltransferase [Thermodesulfobacteriota bacterium]